MAAENVDSNYGFRNSEYKWPKPEISSVKSH